MTARELRSPTVPSIVDRRSRPTRPLKLSTQWRRVSAGLLIRSDLLVDALIVGVLALALPSREESR